MLSKEAKRKANREAQARFKAKNKGIVQKPIIGPIKDAQDCAGSTMSGNTQPVIPLKVIPTVIPEQVIPSNTRKLYRTFEDLSPDTQAEIMRINQWCKDQHIPDNLEQRIGIALDYARMHPDSNSGFNADKTTFTDAVGNKHEWPAVLDTVNTTGKPRVMPEGITANG